jgi:type IV pilus assembly protein PilV
MFLNGVIRARHLPSGTGQRAFTLVEVLVAIVVFSIGLIGLGATMAISIRSNNVAAQRTQAIFLAETLGDMMRANGQAVWANAYDGSYPNGATGTCAANCTPAQLAERDQRLWSEMLQRTLPTASAQVQCTLVAASRPTRPDIIRPPDGLCRIGLTWTENVDADLTTDGVRDQTFSWTFNP